MLGKNLIFIVSATLALSACSSKEKKNETTPRIVRVETVTVAGTGIKNATTYSGTIQEGESTNLSFSTAGTIKQLKVQTGDRITQGQIIGILDDSSLKSAYEIASATLAQTQDAYNRMKILQEANSLPAIKWVDIQQKLIQAQNAVDIAKNSLDDAVLRAPFSGIIADKYADMGQVTAPGIPIVRLIRISDVKASISVPQNSMVNFNEGDIAVIKINDGSERTYNGTLVEKGVSANPLSRAYEIKYKIGNAQGELLPGMVCTVEVAGKEQRNMITLPQSVVLLDERNNNFVWLDSAGISIKRVVKVNALNDNGLEIISGLTDGDKVIVKGIQKVCHGTKVESINE